MFFSFFLPRQLSWTSRLVSWEPSTRLDVFLFFPPTSLLFPESEWPLACLASG